ncbi:MAG: hypothetical protein QM820_48185 [Minicystis sp.]
METISGGNEGALDVLAALVEEQARVARAEAALLAARQRLAALQESYRRFGPSLAALGEMVTSARPPARRARDLLGDGRTLRTRILDHMRAQPGEVLTPALLAPIVGARSRDAVRNALLALAAKGCIEKVGLGQYRVSSEWKTTAALVDQPTNVDGSWVE